MPASLQHGEGPQVLPAMHMFGGLHFPCLVGVCLQEGEGPRITFAAKVRSYFAKYPGACQPQPPGILRKAGCAAIMRSLFWV